MLYNDCSIYLSERASCCIRHSSQQWLNVIDPSFAHGGQRRCQVAESYLVAIALISVDLAAKRGTQIRQSSDGRDQGR